MSRRDMTGPELYAWGLENCPDHPALRKASFTSSGRMLTERERQDGSLPRVTNGRPLYRTDVKSGDRGFLTQQQWNDLFGPPLGQAIGYSGARADRTEEQAIEEKRKRDLDAWKR